MPDLAERYDSETEDEEDDEDKYNIKEQIRVKRKSPIKYKTNEEALQTNLNPHYVCPL